MKGVVHATKKPVKAWKTKKDDVNEMETVKTKWRRDECNENGKDGIKNAGKQMTQRKKD